MGSLNNALCHFIKDAIFNKGTVEMRFYFSLIVLACCPFPAAAQDVLVWGSGKWGSTVWSSLMPAVSIPTLSAGGLLLLIVMMSALPFLTKVKKIINKTSPTK